MQLRVVVLVALLAVVGLSGCTVTNSIFCCSDSASCQRKGATAITTCDDPARPFCDDVGDFGPSNTCIPDPMTTSCERPEDCMTPERPVCDVEGTGTCVRCSVPADCVAFAGRPECDTVTGACVECLTSDQCMMVEEPVCGADHACRRCERNAECATGVCNAGTGVCVPENQIIFVNPAGGGTTCTRSEPCATITAGVGATDATRRYILVAVGSYSERVTVTGRAFVLIGAGADLSAATVGPLLDIQGASNVTIEGLRLHGALGTAGDAVRCSDANGGPSTIVLRQVRIETNGGRGIAATNCVTMVDASRVFASAQGGIVIDRGEITVRNTFIAKNGGPSSTVGGVDLDTPSVLTFEFNTLYDNFATTGFGAGVQCASGVQRVLPNNIIVGQLADQVSSTNCTFDYTVSNEAITGTGNSTVAPTFVNATGDDYHLQPGSSGIDAAQPGAALATDIDGEPRPSPPGRADIGADEVQ